MKKSALIRAGACTLGLSARCLASSSAGAALALVRPCVPHLVSVTLLIFTLARVPCTLHQPIDRALAAVVALSAPGVASLMCVPLVVLALLGADFPGALDYTLGQAGAAVAVVLPPVPNLMRISLVIFAHLVALLRPARYLAADLALTLVAIHLPTVSHLVSVALLIFARFSTILRKTFHLS